MKICWVCGQTKPESDFGVDRSRKDGLNARCKPCDAAKAKERRQNRKYHREVMAALEEMADE